MNHWLELFFITSPPANAEAGEYNYWLVLLSFMIATFAARTAFSASTILVTLHSRKHVVHIAGALALGSGIWAMHFIGMLAYRMRMKVEYAPLLTFVSLVVAVVAGYIALEIVQRKSLTFSHLLIASLFMGLGICTMHYLGMAAMIMDADLRYIPSWFALSVAIAMAASGAALWLLFTVTRLRNEQQPLIILASAVLMGLATCGMHYTGNAAAVFIPLANCRFDAEQNTVLPALQVTAATCIIFGIAFFIQFYWHRGGDAPSLETEFRSLWKLQFISIILLLFIAAECSWVTYSIYISIEKYRQLCSSGVTIPNLCSPSLLDEIIRGIYNNNLLFILTIPLGASLLVIKTIVLIKTRRLFAQASQERRFSQSILDAIPDPIFVKNGQHIWKAGNTSFWKMKGGKSHDFIDRSDETYFKQKSDTLFWKDDDLVMRTGRKIVKEEQVTNTQGETITALITKSSLTLPDGNQGLVGIIHDITALKKIEKELAEHRDNLQQLVDKQTCSLEEEKITITLMQNVSSIANGARTVREMLRPILLLICRFKQWPSGHAYTLDQESNRLTSTKMWHIDSLSGLETLPAAYDNVSFANGEGIPGQVMASGKPCWMENVKTSPLMQNRLQLPDGVRSIVAFPIMDEKKVVAVLEFFSCTPLPYNEDTITLLENIGSQLTVVAERERTERLMYKSMFAAEKANKLKTEFLANMSHELRTPMHSIITFSRQGIERKDRWGIPEQIENLTFIKQSGERLLALLNNLLDLSKLDAGAVEYNFRPCDIEGLIRQALRHLQGLTMDKELQVKLELKDVPLSIVCDEGKILQVVINMLSNAIKFTPPGKAIHIRGQKDVFNIHLTFSDEGIGIPEDELEQIFDKFVQSSKTKSGAGGTGLGLAISKQIILDHQGKIWATNNELGGASFHLLLPLTQAAKEKTS